VFDRQLPPRAADGRAAGAEVLLCRTFGHVDLVPSTGCFDIVIVFDATVVTFSLFEFDDPNSDSYIRKQRGFEL